MFFRSNTKIIKNQTFVLISFYFLFFQNSREHFNDSWKKPTSLIKFTSRIYPKTQIQQKPLLQKSFQPKAKKNQYFSIKIRKQKSFIAFQSFPRPLSPLLISFFIWTFLHHTCLFFGCVHKYIKKKASLFPILISSRSRLASLFLLRKLIFSLSCWCCNRFAASNFQMMKENSLSVSFGVKMAWGWDGEQENFCDVSKENPARQKQQNQAV